MLSRFAPLESATLVPAVAVAAGTLAFGLTDTDDAIVEIERGMPVVGERVVPPAPTFGRRPPLWQE